MNNQSKKLVQVDELLYFILFSHQEFIKELNINSKKQFTNINFNIYAKLPMVGTQKIHTLKLTLKEIDNLIVGIKKYESTKVLEKQTELYKLLVNINKLKPMIIPFKLASAIKIELELEFKSNSNVKLQTPLLTNYVKISSLINEINTII